MDEQPGPAPAPAADCWALNGANRYYPVPAVVLVPTGPAARDGAAHGRWIALAVDMARVLGWPDPAPRVHALGEGDDTQVLLALAVPPALLQTAQALSAWAWAAAAGAPATLPSDEVAVEQLRAQVAAEAPQGWREPVDPPAEQPPTLLVTGSHGKTTVARLLAAMAREAGLAAQLLTSDDTTVPAWAGAAQALLQQPGAAAAVLETPLAALQRQGLVARQATLALITNVSAEAPAEQLPRALDDRAEFFLVVAHALAPGGALVMNGDDAAVLRVALNRPHATAPTWSLFSSDHATPLLEALRRHGGNTCAPRAGRLVLVLAGQEHDLGALSDMPLSLGGAAQQNVLNLAAAALAAALAGWPLPAISHTLAHFGAAADDNPGRLQRLRHRGATVLLDQAQHPVPLAALLKTAAALGARRVGLLLGADGACNDEAIHELARCAAGFRPDRVVIKNLPALPGGREPGVVPLMLEQALRGAGLSSRALRHGDDEEAAAQLLLAWAKAGDVLLMPLHDASVRARLQGQLSGSQAP